MQKLIECVPNFSEGRDLDVIRQITSMIESVDGVSLLDVDPGASTNRTVVTFVGGPEATVQAAFRAIQKAAELIDMRSERRTWIATANSGGNAYASGHTLLRPSADKS